MSHIVTKGFEVRTTDFLGFNAGLAVVFTLLWPGLYYVLHKHLMTGHSPEYTRRCLCVCHWFVSVALSTALYCEHVGFKEKSAELKFEDVAIMNALVFILFDLNYNMYYKTETTLLMINHVVLLTTAVLYIFRDTMRMVFIEGYTLITVTEPLLHLRWFIRHYDRIITIPETIFVIAFFSIRIGFLSFVLHKYVADENVDHIDKALLLANYTTGLLFSIHIGQYLYKKYEGKDTGEILRGVGANPAPEQVVAAAAAS